ncbi:MAG: hypothetical protein ACOYLB_03820 [Phototrophicaceae bacterium]
MRRLSRILATAIAISIGALTILSLLLDGTGLIVQVLAVLRLDRIIRGFAPQVLQLVVTTLAFLIVGGIFNLIGVHTLRVFRRERDMLGSLVLVLSTLAVILLTVLERNGILTATPTPSDILRDSVQLSIESSLAGLLAFSLVFGGMRILRQHLTLPRLFFLFGVILTLLVQAGVRPPTAIAQFLDGAVSAGASGILLGIALGSTVFGVRVLIGRDRSFRE